MSTITTINASDLITNSRSVINTNFSNLNTDKIETSYLDTDTALAANSDTKIATQKAVKTYIDTSGGANASTTVRGIVEEATQAEVTAKTATGGTGARLFINPSSTLVLPPTIQVFTVTGTWTKPSGLTAAIIELVGGGGAGGGSGSNSKGGGGGGGGGYSRKRVVAASLGATETVTIGAGGTVGASGSNSGNAGGTTSFGSHCQATGGNGGLGNGIQGSSTGGVGSSGDINIQGDGGEQDWDSTVSNGSKGGSSHLGGGAASISNNDQNGNVGGNYGGGGGGGYRSSSNVTGGAGAPGVIIVTEFY